MKNYVGPGETVTFTAAAAITSGDIVLVGSLVGVAMADYVSGDTEAVASIKGVYEVPVLGTDVVAVGDVLYYDAGNSRLTLTASTHKVAGKAYAASASGVTTVEVILNQGA